MVCPLNRSNRVCLLAQLPGFRKQAFSRIVGLRVSAANTYGTNKGGVVVVISDAKKLVGRVCAVEWLNRNGEEMRVVSRIHDATFVPLYGGYLITDTDDVRLDRILSIHLLGEDGALRRLQALEYEEL